MVKGNKLANFHSRRRAHHSRCYCQAYDGDVEQGSSSDDDNSHYYENASRSLSRSRRKEAPKFTSISVNLPALSKATFAS